MPPAERRTGFKGSWPRRAPTAATVILAIIALAVYLVTVSPLFKAHTLNVAGNSEFTRAKVLKLAKVDEGTNILSLSGRAVVDRLSADPWIAGAEVTKSYPSTLTITIKERMPAASMKEGDSWVLVAGDGTGLERTQHEPALPLILGVAPPPIGGLSAQATPAATALGLMSESIRNEIEKIVVADDGSLEAFLAGGGRVAYGPPSDLAKKAEALAGIITWAADNHAKIRTIDLTAPDAPAAKVNKPELQYP